MKLTHSPVCSAEVIIICIIVVTHSVMCMLLFTDKFYIHFGGSLEY